MSTKYTTISQQEKLTFVSNLSTMLKAGIPLLSAIDSLLEDTKGNMKKLLETLKADILQGKQLSVSFAKFPRIFNRVTVNMIKASEEAGSLDKALNDLKLQIQQDIAFQSKLISAMVYPILVFGVFLAILLMILIVVIPKIASVFSQLHVNMPLPTKILIFTSNVLLHQTIFVVGGFLIIVTAIFLFYRFKREWFIQFLYSLPVISRLIIEIDLMKFCQSMHILLSSGITITSALELGQESVIRKDIKRALEKTKDGVYAGKTMSSTLKQYKVFPRLMIRLLEAGEKSGTLDTSLKDIAEYFDYKISESLKMLVTALEPVLLIVVGLVVGSMMLAIIAPIYNLIGQISPK